MENIPPPPQCYNETKKPSAYRVNKRLLFSQLFSGSFIEGQRCDGKILIQELSIQLYLRGILMSSLFVHAVDNRNKNMASVNKTMWNYNSMVEV